MPRQEPEARVKNFREVALGYTEEMALKEAARCLQCKNPQCRKGCPVDVPIPEFIELILQGKFAEGIAVIKSKNSLPAICGRVCPQEGQCQMRCIKGKKGDPVNIGRLERFLADWERENECQMPLKEAATGKRVAIIGAGPAGVFATLELVREGKLVRNQVVRVMRGAEAAGTAKISGLKRFKEDVKEVEKGLECGILLDGFKDFRAGDVVEAITKEERIRRLAAPGA